MRSLPFSILMAAILSALMLYFTGLIPAIGEWYSYDQSLRLQTQAFMRGELALQPVPYGHRHDWAWGNGIQQIWGLGVPLLQLPFEVAANLFGFFGFPDRIIFLIFYLLVTAIFWKSLNSAINPLLSDKEQLTRRMQNIPILFFAMLNPAFITMMRAKFGPYEEAIGYGYLWAFMLFSLIYLFLNNPQRRLYFLICLLAGFSANIRPTTGAYGIITFLTVFYLAGQNRIRSRWAGLPFFLAGNLFLLLTNYLRFGNPLEFGHRLLLTGLPVIDYILKFDNPLHWIPFTSSAFELLSALFFTDISKDSILWQSNVPRMREFNFEPYNFFILVLLLTAWIIVTIALVRARGKGFFDGKKEQMIINGGAIWSLCSFLMLFYFYSRSPAIASRYLVDFGPAIVIGISTFYLDVIGIVQERYSRKVSSLLNITLCAAFLGWTIVELSQIGIAPKYSWLNKMEITNVAPLEIAEIKLAEMRRQAGPNIPAGYRCNDRETRYDIPYNNAGWDISASCKVSLVTTHFLDNPKCLAIYVEPIDEAPDLVKMAYSDEEIVVKMGLKRLHRTSGMRFERGKIITYCSDKESGDRGISGQQLKLISIAWGDLRKHPGLFNPPLRMIAIGKVR